MIRRCKTCGLSISVKACRGEFSATERPAAVFYEGRELELTRIPAKLLTRLASTDFVSTADLLAVGVKSTNSLQAHLTAVRRALPDGVTLVNDFGKGYRLVLKH
jgi:hypothetical protein